MFLTNPFIDQAITLKARLQVNGLWRYCANHRKGRVPGGLLRGGRQGQRTRSSTRRQVLPSPISSRSPSSLKGRNWSVSVNSGAMLPST
jgi:hypothetical protein